MNPLMIPAIASLLDKVIPDPAAKADAKIKFMTLAQSGDLKELESATSVIVSEAKSEHWIVSSWRPITMLTFVAIIANNYLLYPYLSLFWDKAPVLVVAPDMWDLLKLGLSGYVVGRSAEKVMKTYKGG
jgi:hypothetical protein